LAKVYLPTIGLFFHYYHLINYYQLYRKSQGYEDGFLDGFEDGFYDGYDNGY